MSTEEDAAVVQLGEPREDVGAATQSRYRYQWECTAATCIAMLVEEDIIGVTCEWHEDYVISYRQRRLELVSVKHRQPDGGPWSLADLCNAGGLAHLFDRWQSADDRTTCRISTNGGLKPGSREARQLAEACSLWRPVGATKTRRLCRSNRMPYIRYPTWHEDTEIPKRI